MCAGSTRMVTFGYQSSRNIVIGQETTTLGHSERIFLPDGEPCGSMGCSYRSHVTFSAFAPGATITSAQDIKYLRLNIEHSWIGDIYIGITCPDGHKASLLKYSNNGSSSCTSSIPSNHRGWSTSSSNVNVSTFLGDPYDAEDYSHPCDSSRVNNRPGTGWNYCWSNNTTSGYTYASGDGIIYRSGHSHNIAQHGMTIDSSNVAARTNFYHPDQDFSSLIGCPLNGDWYIEVMDGWGGDNGYIFEWELSLDAELIPQDECEADSFLVTGYGVTMLNDSSFIIHAPENLTHDTTVYYNYHIYSSCGNDIDSTVALTFHPRYQTDTLVEACGQCFWQGHTYTSSTNLSVNTLSAHGCDSIQMTRIVVHPSYNLYRQISIVENDLPYTYLGHTFYDEVTDTLLAGTTTEGCDSNIVFTLRVARNKFCVVIDTVCSDDTPYLWAGHQYLQSAVDTATFLTSEGADSTVVLQLTVFPSHHSIMEIEAVENDLPVVFDGLSFTASTDTLLRYTSIHGCDSTIHYVLTVHPNHSFVYNKSVCDDELPYEWMGETFANADTITQELLDIHGADSIVTLILTVNPTYHLFIDTTLCDNHPLLVGTTPLNQTGVYSLTLTTAEQCDSIVDVTLTANPHHDIHLYDTVCKADGYSLGDVTYHQTGIYSSLLTNSYGCDSLVTLHLGILREELKAEIKAIPLLVTLSNPDVQLYDASQHNSSSRWLIDGHTYSDRHLTYTYPVDLDSLPVTLVAYSIEGCTDTTTEVIHIDRAAIALPNVFTPGESTNNTWQPGLRDILSMELWIYNREGLLIFHQEGTGTRWDGTKNGEPCPQGAYVYTILYRSKMRPDIQKKINGTITLLR